MFFLKYWFFAAISAMIVTEILRNMLKGCFGIYDWRMYT